MDNNQNNSHNNRNRHSILILLICALISIICMSVFSGAFSGTTSRKIPYSDFVTMLDEGRVKSVEISSDTIEITPKTDDGKSSYITYYTVTTEDLTALTERLDKAGVTYSRKENSVASEVLSVILEFLIPFIFFIVVLNILTSRMGGRGGVMGVGKSRAKEYAQKNTGVTFKDVAGEDEAKESLQEVVGFLHNPEKYREIGAKLPKGALLVGPPGTGKTLLAKAVAGEAGVPFFSLSGSEFVEMFVGVGASRVRDLFEEAKKNAPCIIFIDEIDAIGKRRDSGQYGGNDEREQTLNQLLAEMDGFDTSAGILILAATNRPEVLDPALLRPGRFDRRIIVDRPDLKGRVAILKVHAKDVAMDDTVDLDAIALATSGAVGSDLANMINEAAILAVKGGRRAVSQKDLQEAVEVVLVGKEKKDRILSQEERRIVSYHEVGHALLTALQKNTEPVQKITIIPRTMGALGYVMQVPEEEKYLNSKKELEARLVVLLGGRAAEEIVFDTVTTGAANDIEQATNIARAMITQYGMSEKFGLMGLASQENQYLDGRTVMNCGDETATEVDHEVMALLKRSYDEALRLLRAHRATMDKIAAFLIARETITGKEFMKIYRECEGGANTENAGSGTDTAAGTYGSSGTAAAENRPAQEGRMAGAHGTFEEAGGKNAAADGTGSAMAEGDHAGTAADISGGAPAKGADQGTEAENSGRYAGSAASAECGAAGEKTKVRHADESTAGPAEDGFAGAKPDRGRAGASAGEEADGADTGSFEAGAEGKRGKKDETMGWEEAFRTYVEHKDKKE